MFSLFDKAPLFSSSWSEAMEIMGHTLEDDDAPRIVEPHKKRTSRRHKGDAEEKLVPDLRSDRQRAVHEAELRRQEAENRVSYPTSLADSYFDDPALTLPQHELAKMRHEAGEREAIREPDCRVASRKYKKRQNAKLRKVTGCLVFDPDRHCVVSAEMRVRRPRKCNRRESVRRDHENLGGLVFSYDPDFDDRCDLHEFAEQAVAERAREKAINDFNRELFTTSRWGHWGRWGRKGKLFHWKPDHHKVTEAIIDMHVKEETGNSFAHRPYTGGYSSFPLF